MNPFFNNWIQEIIVAVIISSFIEMILPKGSMKKYIKVIIGIYIVFSIIAPIINKIGKKDLAKSMDVDKFVTQMSKSENNISKTIKVNNYKTIKDVYINNLEENIKIKLESNGYDIRKINIIAKDDENYTIEKVEIFSNKKVENSKIQIDDIILSQDKELNINDKTINNFNNEIKDLISSEYNIDKSVIFIK